MESFDRHYTSSSLSIRHVNQKNSRRFSIIDGGPMVEAVPVPVTSCGKPYDNMQE
jgi:hypothetical protein